MFTYNSVADLYGAMDATRARLRDTLADLSPEQESLRDGEGRWSIGEVVEHLSILDTRIAGLAARFVEKAESEGALREQAGGDIGTIDLSEFAARGAEEKYVAPELVRPAGSVAVSDSLARMDEARDALRLLQPRIEALDLSGHKYPHPAFGPLDLYHWLAVLALHEERHRRQIEVIKQAHGAAPHEASGAA
jgi:hypothetical protein